MVVSEGAINNIMSGMENTAGVRLHSHRHKLKQRFDIVRKLGQGTYGKVQLAVNKETGQEVAIKTIKKAKIETEQDLIRIRREIQIMSSVQHPQIIHIYEVFENREKMVLVMEYAAGGELYDYLSERKVLSEDEARRVFRHVASATYYCHKHKICHRDLKLENILLDLDGNAKIADFGLSNVFDDKHRLDTFCGSPLYASPEIVKGIPYTGPEVDCWSLGVLLYTLVYGAMPFDGSNFKRLVKQITQGDYYEPKKPSRASELIRQMLTVSADKRATIEEICGHWWVDEGQLEPCLEVAEALANQTPVRLDLLLSLAPKHINSEHMLIQPDDDDSTSSRPPPTSEASRPPPLLDLPPPPPTSPPGDGAARSASLGAMVAGGCNDIEALVAQRISERRRKKKEEDEEEEGRETGAVEKKKKKKKEEEEEETGTIEKKKKKKKKIDDEEEEEEKKKKRDSTGGKRPPSRSEDTERKRSVRKEGGGRKRDSMLTTDGEGSDISERSERQASRKGEGERRKTAKSDGEKKKSVKKREQEEERRKSTKREEEEQEEERRKIKREEEEQEQRRSTRKELEEEEEGGRSKSRVVLQGSPSGKKVTPASRETRSPVGEAGEAATHPAHHATQVSDARKAFEAKPAEKPAIVSRKKPAGESLPGSPSNEGTPTSPTPKDSPAKKSPSKEVTALGKEKEEKEKVKEEKKEKDKSPKDVIERAKKSPSKGKAVKETEGNSERTKQSTSKLPSAERKTKAEETLEKKEEKRGSKVEENGEKPKCKDGEEEAAAVVVGGLSVKLGEVGRISEISPTSTTTSLQDISSPLTTRPQSDSSDSESEAEKLLKMVSEKREKVEAARQERLKKASEEKEVTEGRREATEGRRKSSEERREAVEEKAPMSPSRSPPSSPANQEGGPETKFATLPRGFKSRTAGAVGGPRSGPAWPKKEKAIDQEIEGMMSAIRAVDRAITKEEEQIKVLRDSLGPACSREGEEEEKEKEGRGMEGEGRQIPPHTPIPSPPKESTHTHPRSLSGDSVGEVGKDRKTSQLEIVLNPREQQQQQPQPPTKRASYTEIKLSSPTTRQPPRTPEHRTEVPPRVRGAGVGEPQLQRAKRERIIPIMLEDDEATPASPASPTPSHPGYGGVGEGGSGDAVAGGAVSPPPPPLHHATHTTTTHPCSPLYTPSPEPIRKSRRERIIPIAVEGEGILTPPPPPSAGSHVDEAAELGAAQAHRAFTRTLASHPSSLSRGYGDPSDSLSSAGEEEEEDEDDGFQILTAESLFSTLLNRVRSLTRKMNQDEGRGSSLGGTLGRVGSGVGGAERARRLSRPSQEPGTAPVSHPHSSGFWSSLYTSPRDSPARRISETMSRSSTMSGRGGDEDPFPPMWARPGGLSRDASDTDSFFSEAASSPTPTPSPFTTLPRVRTLRHSLHLQSPPSPPPPPPLPLLTPRLLPDSLFLSDFSYPT